MMLKFSMNNLLQNTGRSLVFTGILIAIYTSGLAQKPVIRNVDKVNGSNGEVVTLHGTFNNDATKTVVWFGAVKGNIRFISGQLLEVHVPAGTTYQSIVVTDITTGLSDYSNAPFLLSFGGNHGIIDASLEGQPDFNSQSGLYDLCMCDFDNDGKTDIATANDNANTLNIMANSTLASGLTNISFNPIPIAIATRSLHAKCGDLNGDGKPDLVISEGGSGGDRVFVLRNTSTGAGVFTFSTQSIRLTGKKVKRVEIADVDNNGKPEVIVTNQMGNNVTVLINESTLASIIFNTTPITLSISGAASTDGLGVEDIDGDGLPEIVTSQFLTGTSNLIILKNTSIPGNISFAAHSTLPLTGTVVNLKIGDLDGDNKPEIAITQLLGSGIVIFKNQSTTTPDFAAPVSVLTDEKPWGIDFGDIDGDGKTDIVVASLAKSVTVLNNESTPSALAFSALVKPTTFINRHVSVGDVDGDGKPDIAFTSIDDNNSNILASKISIIRNKTCLIPVLDPEGPLTICAGLPFQLTTTESRGTTYTWKNGATTLSTGADAFFDVTVSGNYTVTATGEAGTCIEVSNTVSITVTPGTTTGPAIASNDGPICAGSNLALSVNDVGGTAYNWRGPEGYTGAGLTPAPIPNFQAQNAGRYYLDVVVGTCIAQQTSTVVQMIGVPDFQVTYSGSDVICQPDPKVLSIVPNDPDFSYQWAENATGDIGGATTSTITATSTGDYFVKAQYILNPACASISTEKVTITFSVPPVANFNVQATGCVGEVITFANQSTGDAFQTPFYDWAFGDSQTSAEQHPSHQYASVDDYPVTLRVSYNGGACPSEVTKNISIESAPEAIITTPGNTFNLCDGDSLALEISGPFTAYQWSTGETTSSILVKLPGVYNVDVNTSTCTISAIATVTLLESPKVTVMANPEQVNEGGASQLSASGLTTYLWEPGETLSDPSIANPMATPLLTTTYVVGGTDANGCSGGASIEVSVKGDLIVNKLKPSRFFSPDNGDDLNDSWLIENIQDYPQCLVTIYDLKGIKVFEAKPYTENNWDGTYKGKALPDGVYYYLIRCEGEEETPKTGSITLLR